MKSKDSKQSFRVLVLTDSLGLPRDKPQFVSYDETYFSLLQKDFYNMEFVQCSIGGGTVEQLCSQAEYLRLFCPKVVILQTGIVDASPRALTKFEGDLIARIPIVSRLISALVRKNKTFLRKKRNISYTDQKTFEVKVRQIKEIFKEAEITCLGIIPASKEYEVLVPGVGKNVEEFNAELKNIFKDTFIDNSDLTVGAIMTDHHHLNKTGHHLVYKKLKNVLERAENPKEIQKDA